MDADPLRVRMRRSTETDSVRSRELLSFPRAPSRTLARYTEAKAPLPRNFLISKSL